MNDKFIKEAYLEGVKGVQLSDGGPFGAVIVDQYGNIISRGHNMVLKSHDPTNHAEVVAIREACLKIQSHDLTGYTIYSSCEPCPMCLSAIIWSNISTVYYGATRWDAAKAGFRDDAIYNYLNGENSILEKKEIFSDECRELLEHYKGEKY